MNDFLKIEHYKTQYLIIRTLIMTYVNSNDSDNGVLFVKRENDDTTIIAPTSKCSNKKLIKIH